MSANLAIRHSTFASKYQGSVCSLLRKQNKRGGSGKDGIGDAFAAYYMLRGSWRESVISRF